MAVKAGDLVKVEYEGTLKDGTVFDSTEKYDAPLEFLAGETLRFKIKVVEYGDPPEGYLEQLESEQQGGCGCGCTEHSHEHDEEKE